MRNLVVLRGCPGAGKSTWIKENGLEPYTLSPDNIRMMTSAPVLTTEGTDVTISQENESYVWELLYELLEKRMQNGDFTIIDATHSRSTDFSRYNSLCNTYKYRRYVVSFTDVPKEVCIQRNHERDAYKRVPDNVIEKMYARFGTQDKTSGWVDVPKDKFWEVFRNKAFDYNEYEQLHILGDIHGCFEPLKEYILLTTNKVVDGEVTPANLKDYLNEKDAYIFVGDYIDRGIQNKEVLEFMISIMDNKNVLMLEGNHERNLWYWANEQDGFITSKDFMYRTVPQIKDINSSDLRQFYRKLGQMAFIQFKGNLYLITHAGLNCVPDYLQFISTSQFIKGVGVFKTPIDEIFTKNSYSGVKQVHGHRNIEENNDTDKSLSISLEDRVEFGGNFLSLFINKDDNEKVIKIKNNVFREETEEERIEALKSEELDMKNIVEKLRLNRNIKESHLDNNISSFNFTRTAFEKGKWDKETIKARGLFIDTEKNKIVARGYEKFFNVNEQESSKLFNLRPLFDNNEVIAYKKYNGFLGILSYYNDSLQFHSKSTNVGEFANYFRTLFYKQFGNQQISLITNYLKEHDVSMTFEVIDLENDPHIIDEKESRCVLLDIIKNELEFDKLPYEEVSRLAKLWGLKENEYKQVYTKFDNYRQLTEFYSEHKDENKLVDTDIEGVVIEAGKFMTKLKFSYYSFWKGLREVARQTQSGKVVKLNRLFNATSNYFYKFVKDRYEEKTNRLLEIRKELDREDIPLSDFRKAKLDFNTDEIVITRQTRRRYYSEDETDLNFNEEIRIKVDKDLIDEMSSLLKQEDIISLRKQYYANGGI